MKIFSFLGLSSSTPEWTYVSRGSIWRIVFSQSGTIVGESRDHEQKTASFFCIDERTGSVVWQDMSVHEPWWVGIDSVYRDVIIFHEFANPGLPEHRGILVSDLGSGKLLWHNRELTFWFAFKEFAYAYKPMFEKRIGYKLSLKTGEVLEEFGDALDELYVLRKLAQDEQQQEGFLFPEVLEQGAVKEEVSAFVHKETKGKKVHGQVEFIHHPPYVLLNYYTPGRTSTEGSLVLENRFSIFDTERKSKIFGEILAIDAKAPTPDSFFVKGELAYFIKDQRVLTALRLHDRSK